MNLLFNKDSNGQAEIKATLGFLDAGFTYANIQPDIKLNTPYLIDFIGQETYDKIYDYYKTPPGTPDVPTQTAVEYCQLYILSMAYLDYAPNNDLTHSNSGRSFRNDENEKLPWDWQVNKDNSAIAKRAYKALDLLFILLDEEAWSEWTSSEAYTKANALFIKNTKIFDSVFPINKSGQLYYRLVPFMNDFETDHIYPILTPTVADALKAEASPDANEKALLSLIYKAVAYFSLSKALKVFPVEMFPEGLMYNENTREKSEARAEVMLFLKQEAENYLTRLEHLYAQQNETFTTLETKNGLTEGKKYVNL